MADYNANVRSGPDEDFAIVDFLLLGDQANAVGRYLSEETGTWYYLIRLNEGINGWIWGGAVTILGDEDLIPFLDPPPEPTEGPSPTPFS
jgi:uncharacterized protein YgiM (DUF1202 family)